VPPSSALSASLIRCDALFETFDIDGGGSIDYRELHRALRRHADLDARLLPGGGQPPPLSAAAGRTSPGGNVQPSAGVNTGVNVHPSAEKATALGGVVSGNASTLTTTLAAREAAVAAREAALLTREQDVQRMASKTKQAAEAEGAAAEVAARAARAEKALADLQKQQQAAAQAAEAKAAKAEEALASVQKQLKAAQAEVAQASVVHCL